LKSDDNCLSLCRYDSNPESTEESSEESQSKAGSSGSESENESAGGKSSEKPKPKPKPAKKSSDASDVSMGESQGEKDKKEGKGQREEKKGNAVLIIDFDLHFIGQLVGKCRNKAACRLVDICTVSEKKGKPKCFLSYFLQNVDDSDTIWCIVS